MVDQVTQPSREFFLQRAILASVSLYLPYHLYTDGAPQTLRHLLDLVTLTDDSWFVELVTEKFNEEIAHFNKYSSELRI
jgi:hypothetical protein